ncbi:DEAD/DEAH box helicase [Candidatus Dependentiae bacterium]|nr:DEAD/DEAH box helicase [Candidatus Dependentiae bacterium]
MKTFADIDLLPEIKKSLDALNFTTPTEVQAKVIPILLKNPESDVHVQAPTGTGKTLAYGIPLLDNIDPSLKAVQGMVIAPTRELVLQIYESLKDISRHTNIIIEPVFGGMPIERQIANIKRGAQIIVGTPGRLNDHLRRKTLSLNALKILILDEADIMLDMGFKEEISSILEYAPKDRAIWLFSATVMAGISQLIKSHMKNVLTIKTAAKESLTPQVEQYYCLVPSRNKIKALTRFIEAAPDFYGIIFCRTKMLTSEVMEELISKGFKTNCLHGDMKQTLRNHVIKGFKNKDFSILVATDVAARGIDVSELTHVINFSIPEEYESYVHRIGRTGRAGKKGVAITFILPSEVFKIKKLEKAVNAKLQEIPVPPIDTIIHLKVGAVSDFIEQAKKPDIRLSPVHKVVKDLISSFSEDEIRNSLAMALEDKFFKDMVHDDLGQVSHEKTSSVPQEICIELGLQDGLTEEDVRNYLYPTCTLLPNEVNKVRVLPNKTFISIPENRLEKCLEAMKTNPVSKKPHKVFLVRAIFGRKPERGWRQERGRRFERGGRPEKRRRY